MSGVELHPGPSRSLSVVVAQPLVNPPPPLLHSRSQDDANLEAAEAEVARLNKVIIQLEARIVRLETANQAAGLSIDDEEAYDEDGNPIPHSNEPRYGNQYEPDYQVHPSMPLQTLPNGDIPIPSFPSYPVPLHQSSLNTSGLIHPPYPSPSLSLSSNTSSSSSPLHTTGPHYTSSFTVPPTSLHPPPSAILGDYYYHQQQQVANGSSGYSNAPVYAYGQDHRVQISSNQSQRDDDRWVLEAIEGVVGACDDDA